MLVMHLPSAEIPGLCHPVFYKFLVGKQDVNTVKQLKTCNGSFVYKSIELESWKITDYKNC